MDAAQKPMLAGAVNSAELGRNNYAVPAKQDC